MCSRDQSSPAPGVSGAGRGGAGEEGGATLQVLRPRQRSCPLSVGIHGRAFRKEVADQNFLGKDRACGSLES